MIEGSEGEGSGVQQEAVKAATDWASESGGTLSKPLDDKEALAGGEGVMEDLRGRARQSQQPHCLSVCLPTRSGMGVEVHVAPLTERQPRVVMRTCKTAAKSGVSRRTFTADDITTVALHFSFPRK